MLRSYKPILISRTRPQRAASRPSAGTLPNYGMVP